MTGYNATSSSEYQIMILELLMKDRREYKTEELYRHIEQSYTLTEQDCQMKRDGSEPVWKNMVRRSVASLRDKGLVESPGRGVIIITDHGIKCMEQGDINVKAPEKPAKKTVKKSRKKMSILDLQEGDRVRYTKSLHGDGIVKEVNRKKKYVRIIFDNKEERVLSCAQNLQKL